MLWCLVLVSTIFEGKLHDLFLSMHFSLIILCNICSFNVAVGFAESVGMKESIRGISGQSLVTVVKSQ
jgi:hypothetical protein